MKKIYLIIALSFIMNGYSQFNPNAPWMQQSNSTQKNQEATFEESVNTFNNYWKTRDYKAKASGYKPFRRWEYKWKNDITDQGYLISPSEINAAFQQKQQSKLNKASRSALALPVSNWQPIGPYNNALENTRARGRVNVIVADPSNANTLYMGTPAGGIWKSTNHGTSWAPLSDNLPQIGVSGIAVDFSNQNTIYIATGDKDAGDTYSIGVLKSTDGGVTWNTTGLSFAGTGSRAGDLIMHPTDNQILWCATSAGLYKTTNGGANWSVVQAGMFHQGSVRLKPGDPTVVYASTYNVFYRSTNTGSTFAAVALPGVTSSSRMLLDVTPADPLYVYVLTAKTDADKSFQLIHRSINSGATFVRRTAIGSPPNFFGNATYVQGTQSWYDLAFAVSSTNVNELYIGCLNIRKSSDGGVATANWTMLNEWNVKNASFTHADIHSLQFINNKLYCGSDGGVYVSSDTGTNFSDITTGAQISQFYKISVAKQTAAKVVGGTQDNGGWVYNTANTNPWQSYHGGDGMDCAVNPINNNKIYGFVYEGGTLFGSNDTGATLATGLAAPTGEVGEWVTPLKINSAGDVFAGYSKLFRVDATGAWVQQNTSNLGTGNIIEIEIAPSNDNIMFVSKGASLYKSTDKGVTFALVYTAASAITSICVNYSDTNLVYLTTAGTGGLALKSTNGGTIFASFSTNLPAIGKNVIKHQGRNTLNPLYIGTSLGVYYRDDSMSQWEPFETNLPNVSVRDLEINLEDNVIIAGTYGRGIWQCAIPVEVPPSDIKFVAIQNPTVSINCGNLISPEISVKNNGTNPITSVDVAYDYNGAPLNYNWTGSIASLATQIITLPSFTVVTKGAYNLNVNTTITGDAYSDNNKGVSSFYVNDAGTLAVLNTFTTAADNLLTYTEGAITSQWQRGVNTNGALATPGNSVYSTNLTAANYPDKTKAYLYSQCYNLTNAVNPQIKFKMGFALEQNWDIVYVQYSTNMGQNWSVLGTMGANWYNSNRTNASSGAANDCQNCPGAQWTGGSGATGTGTGAVTALTDYFYTLNSLIGQPNVIFRIVFESDDSTFDLGVNIDNFIIDGTLSNQDFELKNIAIYPNPSTGLFTVSTGNKAIDKIEVYDVSGKVVLSADNFSGVNSQSTLDLRNVSGGIYFVKISSEGLSTVKRVIKN